MSNEKKSVEELLYLTDGHRNVICVPYSIENLHKMADDLGIKRSWFKEDHYEIPDSYYPQFEDKCERVTTPTLFKTVKNMMVI